MDLLEDLCDCLYVLNFDLIYVGKDWTYYTLFVVRDVKAEAEAVALKCNRFRFHSGQRFPTEGKFLTREEFHKLGVCFK